MSNLITPAPQFAAATFRINPSAKKLLGRDHVSYVKAHATDHSAVLAELPNNLEFEYGAKETGRPAQPRPYIRINQVSRGPWHTLWAKQRHCLGEVQQSAGFLPRHSFFHVFFDQVLRQAQAFQKR